MLYFYPGLPHMCLTVHEYTYIQYCSSLQCFTHHNLYLQELCDLAHSTSPMSVLGEKLEELPNDSRGLLKQLLRLFGQVNKYNKTVITVYSSSSLYGEQV